jgi:hypothetical protein|tara:strand:+ start:139 stop:360 length:222 start_codon:yes stop_codon:yes gene_type:complete
MFPASLATIARAAGQQRMKDYDRPWGQFGVRVGFQNPRGDFVARINRVFRAARHCHAVKQVKISAANTAGKHL